MKNISISRLITVAIIAFASTFATYIATALQSTEAHNLNELLQVISVQAVKAISIATAGAVSAVVAFFTRPDKELPANAVRHQVTPKTEE